RVRLPGGGADGPPGGRHAQRAGGAPGRQHRPAVIHGTQEAAGVVMVAAANDPGERGDSRAARWLLAPPSCGAQHPARILRAAPRRSSLRLPFSLPGSFISLTMITPAAS